MSLRDKLFHASKLVIPKEAVSFDISIIMPVREETTEYINMTRESFLSAGATRVIQVDDIEGKGASWARNEGASQVKSGVIIFTDAHVKWQKGSLIKFAKNAVDNTCINVAPIGSLDNPNGGTYYGGDLQDHKRFPGYNLKAPNTPSDTCKALYGSVYAVSVETWKYLGGWPPTVGWGYNEQALTLLSRVRGVELRVEKDAKALHKFRRNSPYKSDTRQVFANHIIIHHALSTEKEWYDYWHPRFLKHEFTRRHPDIWDFVPTLGKNIGWLRNAEKYLVRADGVVELFDKSIKTPAHFLRKGNLLIPEEVNCEYIEVKEIKRCKCRGGVLKKMFCKKNDMYTNRGMCLKCTYGDLYKEI